MFYCVVHLHENSSNSVGFNLLFTRIMLAAKHQSKNSFLDLQASSSVYSLDSLTHAHEAHMKVFRFVSSSIRRRRRRRC